MPKVIQINTCANWGSTGKIAEQINVQASNLGWITYIAYGRSVNPSCSKLIHIGSVFSQAIALMEARLFDNEGLSSRFATKRLVKEIDSIQPDVVHLHNLHGYFINYRILFEYLNSTSIKVVWTLHDCWTFTGHCAHFLTANCDKWKNKCGSCPVKKNYPASWLLDRSTRNIKLKQNLFLKNKNLHIVTVSQWLSGCVKQSFLRDKDISVIYNGVDFNLFKPVCSPTMEKVRLLGVASVWTQSKGLYDFFRLRERLDCSKYDIVLVGLSKTQIRKLPKGIIGIERTGSSAELVKLYSSAHIFINPTYADTLATTNIEAQACGTPVISYNVGGCPETISEETGIIVPVGNIDAIINAIHLIQKNRNHYSLNCRKYVMSKFQKELQYPKYISLYEKIKDEKN